MRMNKLLMLLLFAVLVADTSEVCAQQRSPKRRNNRTNNQNKSNDYFGNSNDTNKNSNSGSNSNDYFGGSAPGGPGSDTTKKNFNNNPNLPIEFVPSNGNNPLTDTIKPSLRNEDAIERNLVKDRAILEYEDIREDDAVYMQKVWRVIDTREKMNLPFKNPAIENGGSQLFLSILYKAVTDPDNPVTAFKDERFSEFYTPDEFAKKFSGGYDTIGVVDINSGEVTKRQVRQRSFMVDSVYEYQIKEEWIFDKESSRMFVRIIGIAPMMKTYLQDGTPVSDRAFPMFWLYYPDLRPLLATKEVYNPKNYGARMTWEDLFEGRMFSSRIIKSTLDNPYDLPFASYIKDRKFQLYEGEKVKEKIFDYEQSLWSY